MPELAVDPRKVGGAFSVDENARRLIHYRFAENVCMTAAAAWASSCQTIKVKFALGEHCYEDSIHSFWLGQRLPELRGIDDVAGVFVNAVDRTDFDADVAANA